jgi:DnaJ-class molecular chaperone
MAEDFKRCGEGENVCNCKTEAECGYLFDYDIEDVELCDKCQSEKEWQECWDCGGEGGQDGEELMEEDPLWYSPDDFRKCDTCNGKGGFYVCHSSKCRNE